MSRMFGRRELLAGGLALGASFALPRPLFARKGQVLPMNSTTRTSI